MTETMIATETKTTTSSKESRTSNIDPKVVKSEFCKKSSAQSLRVTCYGSSSSATPERYMKEARSLGYILARRGHICVNGAGQYGCMAAMNDGALAGNGHIIGVIHEMFLVDSGYWDAETQKIDVDALGSKKTAGKSEKDPSPESRAHQAFEKGKGKSRELGGAIREILVAGGNDLQQRKKLLVENADALVVLPGGPGTWDELWEMACMRNIGLTTVPIVCIDVDGYYAPFREMLFRAFADKLVCNPPDEIVHFAPSSEQAIKWIEATKEKEAQHAKNNPSISRKHSPKRGVLKAGSFYGRTVAMEAAQAEEPTGNEGRRSSMSAMAPSNGVREPRRSAPKRGVLNTGSFFGQLPPIHAGKSSDTNAPGAPLKPARRRPPKRGIVSNGSFYGGFSAPQGEKPGESNGATNSEPSSTPVESKEQQLPSNSTHSTHKGTEILDNGSSHHKPSVVQPGKSNESSNSGYSTSSMASMFAIALGVGAAFGFAMSRRR